MSYLCDSVAWSAIWLLVGYAITVLTMLGKGRP